MSSTSTRGRSRKTGSAAAATTQGRVAGRGGGRSVSARPPVPVAERSTAEPMLTAQRALLLAAVPVTALAFSRRLIDSVSLPKLTFLVLLVLALLVVTAVRTVRGGRVVVPTGPLAYALALFTVGLLLATVTAEKTSIAVLGVSGRGSGLLLYLSGVVLALGVLRWFDADTLRRVALVLVASGSAVAAYALLQAAGVDPIDWTGADITVISTLGNANFAAAYMGITVPAAVWGALTGTLALPWRVACGVVAVAALAGAVAAESVQGPLAAAVGLGVLLVAWLLERRRTVRTAGLALVAVGGTAAVAAVGLGLTGSGPLAPALDTETLQFRRWYWQAALAMTGDHPVLGVGLANYVDFYRLYRTEAATLRLGYNSVADDAHDVPLQLLSGGGVVLLAGWLAVVAVALVALVVGLRRLRGERRLLLGGLGGAWAAYQVQSLVSLDVPALSVLHFVLAGSLVVLALPPGEAGLAVPTASRRGQPNGLGWTVVGIASLLALFAAVQMSAPWRADAAAFRAEQAAATGDGNTAIEELGRAQDLAPYDHRYWYKQGEVFDRASQPEDGARSFARALAVNPRVWEAAVRAAQDYQNTGDLEKALDYYERSYAIDPTTPEILADGSGVALTLGDAERAEEYARRAVDVNPELAQGWAALGKALAAQDETEEARAALERALQLEPGRADATEALAALQSS